MVLRTGVDYSWDRPDPMALVGAGFTFAARYVSNDLRASGGRTKLLDRAEAERLTGAGVDVVLVWEGRAADRDPLKGSAQGAADAREAVRQAALCGAPDGVPILFAVDWDVTSVESDRLDPYFAGALEVLGDTDRVGVYGGFRAVNALFNRGRVGLGWQTYAWSGGRWDTRAQLRQVLNGQTVGGAAVDFNEAHADVFGQWKAVGMTFAPPDILEIQRYFQQKTGLPWASLGIIHATPQGGGYHEGDDLLRQAGRLATDYSKAESARDRAVSSNAASAFDLVDFSVVVAGRRVTHLDIINGVVAAYRANDPRARDLREMIYSLDDVTVKRLDRLGVRSSGDDSHKGHTHFSWFRDAEGRRNRDDNFLGLFKEIFDGATNGDGDMTPEEHAWLQKLIEWQAQTIEILGAIADNKNRTWNRPVKLVDEIAALRTGLTTLGERPAVTLTDEQLAAFTDRVSAAVGEAVAGHPGTGLTVDDVRTAVEGVLRGVRFVAQQPTPTTGE